MLKIECKTINIHCKKITEDQDLSTVSIDQKMN